MHSDWQQTKCQVGPFEVLCSFLSINVYNHLGLYEVAKKGDPPVMGITKMEDGITLEEMKRPWIRSTAGKPL
jgi:hypothetical protein